MQVRLPPHAEGGSVLETRYATADFGPEDHGFLSWSFDPALGIGSLAATAGQIQLVKLKLPGGPVTITNLHLYIATSGATLTASQCYAMLYGPTGVLLSQTAQQATLWQSSGLKTMALTAAQVLNSGYCYVGFYSNGTTQPAFLRGTSISGSNTNLSAPNFRFATGATVTTTPSNPFGTQTASSNAFWAAVS